MERSVTEPAPTFDCPRRLERTMALWLPEWTNQKHADYIDMALDPEGHPLFDDAEQLIAPQDHWRADGTCSYCGGMSPEGLFEAIACGAELGPTDKNYKVYVEGGRRIALGGAAQPWRGKFYTVHLNRENAARLRSLIEEGQVRIGYPGHFYNGLWLAPPKPAESEEQHA